MKTARLQILSQYYDQFREALNQSELTLIGEEDNGSYAYITIGYKSEQDLFMLGCDYQYQRTLSAAKQL